MTTLSREVHMKTRPNGLPVADNFEIVEVPVKDPGEGEVRVRNIYMSVDPYMRGRMRMEWPEGAVLSGAAVGQVVASKNREYREGDYVNNSLGWREYFLSDGAGLSHVDPDLAPLSSCLGVMGMPGLTAYGGLLVTSDYQQGETVFVSAASGAVGNVVGQIVKIKGGTAIGSAGSPEKVRALTDEFGFDHAFNYKTDHILEELRKGAPEGIDIYFENVGGRQLEAALTHMKPHGRIPICGMISLYNDTTPSPGPRNLTETIYKHITLKGFVVSAFMDIQAQFHQDMSEWIRSGRLKYNETIYDGIENAARAFIGLFRGANDGKMLVRLADPD